MLIAKLKVVMTVVLVAGLVCGVTGWGIFGDPTAVARPEPSKEAKQQLDAAREKIRFVQLGQKRDQLIARFGDPKKVTTFVGGIESLEFQNGDNRMGVEIHPETQQVIQIYYLKKTPFNEFQVMELLSRNAEGELWIPAEQPGVFIRSDGGIARGSGNGKAGKDGTKIGEEYQFAILSGSEIVSKQPAEAAKRKKEVEDALKELEGF